MKTTHRFPIPIFVALAASISGAAAGQSDIPRLPDGTPDLSGTYDIATLTPLERPEEFGENLYLTPDQARKIEREKQEYLALRAADTDPDREAPPVGGA